MVRSLVPWSVSTPRLFNTFRDEMNQLVDRLFRWDDGGETVLAFMPRANIAETEAGYEITVDLPGMKPEDFNLEIKEGHLWISGHREHETEEKDKTYHRIERQYGEFRRVIPLDAGIDPEKVDAEYKDGVLTVRVPKTEAARPKRIEVKS